MFSAGPSCSVTTSHLHKEILALGDGTLEYRQLQSVLAYQVTASGDPAGQFWKWDMEMVTRKLCRVSVKLSPCIKILK